MLGQRRARLPIEIIRQQLANILATTSAQAVLQTIGKEYSNAILKKDGHGNPVFTGKSLFFKCYFYLETLHELCQQSTAIPAEVRDAIAVRWHDLNASLKGESSLKTYVVEIQGQDPVCFNNFEQFHNEYVSYKSRIDRDRHDKLYLESMLIQLSSAQKSRAPHPLRKKRPHSAITAIIAPDPAPAPTLMHQKRNPQVTVQPPLKRQRSTTVPFYQSFKPRFLQTAHLFQNISRADHAKIISTLNAAEQSVRRLHPRDFPADMQCAYAALRTAPDEFIIFKSKHKIHERHSRKLRTGIVYRYSPQESRYGTEGEARVLDTVRMPLRFTQGIFSRNLDAPTNAWQLLYGETHVLQRVEKKATADAEQQSVAADYLKMYSSMHFLDGQNMDDFQKKNDTNLLYNLDRLLEILEALQHLHQAGILHRDIKRENVKIINGHAYLFDFGFAVYTDSAPNNLDGSPLYMAPEAFNGIHDVASEIYSAGMLAAEWTFGLAVLNNQHDVISNKMDAVIAEKGYSKEYVAREKNLIIAQIDHKDLPRLSGLTALLSKSFNESELNFYTQLIEIYQKMTNFNPEQRGDLAMHIQNIKALRQQAYEYYHPQQKPLQDTDSQKIGLKM